MKWGAFAGITTNPIILKKAGLDVWNAINDLSPIFNGDFFVQTWGDSADEMIANAVKVSSKLGKRVIIKVPSTTEGLKTIHSLSSEGIWTAATALFTPGQAGLAAEAGASFVIPFYNRIEESGGDAAKTVEQICKICRGNVKTKVVVASIKKIEQFFRLPAEVFAITIPPQLAREMIASKLTDNVLKRFKEAASEEPE